MVKAEKVIVDQDGEGDPITLDWFIQQFNEQIAQLTKMVNEHHGDMYNLHGRMNIHAAKMKHLMEIIMEKTDGEAKAGKDLSVGVRGEDSPAAGGGGGSIQVRAN